MIRFLFGLTDVNFFNFSCHLTKSQVMLEQLKLFPPKDLIHILASRNLIWTTTVYMYG